MKNIYLLGASGSIGTQTLEVIDEFKNEFKLVAFSVGKNIEKALEIIGKYQPSLVCVENQNDVKTIIDKYPNIKCVSGNSGLIDVATYNKKDKNGVLIVSVVGMIGLEPTIEAIKIKRDILLANKETLVVGGDIITKLVKQYKVRLLPIDSEHSAIMQCLQGFKKEDVKNLIITASGGAFRDKTREELVNVTIEDALKHPNWSMGKNITVDCATMVNKGLEVIEAHHLFGIDYDNIQTIIHRESIIHSLVEYNDGSIMANLSNPDMRLPIQYALMYPNKKENKLIKRLSLKDIKSLSFEEMNMNRYPCLALAYDVGKIGGLMPTVYNGSNEEAVRLFIENKIRFLDIETIIFEMVNKYKSFNKDVNLKNILELNDIVRNDVKENYEEIIKRGGRI